MNYIDQNYVSILSSRLEKFKRISPSSYTFRCPICGDSKKSSYKTRGYILERTNKIRFFCHNCGASMTFNNFLKWLDPNLHRQYVAEKYLENKGQPQPVVDITKIEKPRYLQGSPLARLKKISQLAYDHPAKLYIKKRLIPPDTHYKLFYAPKFNSWVNSIIPNKLNDKEDEPRLVIPFIDTEGVCYGFQGRAFHNKSIRYITIMLDDTKPKVFGLDTIDFDKQFFITEGPIDSLFLPNSIAMAGSDMDVTKLVDSSKAKLFATFVYDNEPRNVQIVKKMEKIIDMGYNIVIWPSILNGIKDINDMVMAGHNPIGMVNQFTFRGPEAKLKFIEWKKV